MSQLIPWGKLPSIINAAASVGENVLLYGPSGTGKSWIARDSNPVYALQCTEEGCKSDSMGYDRNTKDGFVFARGPAPMAFLNGCRLVIEEVEKASGDMFSHLLSVLDDPRFSTLQLPDERIIKPAAGFHVIGTSNVETPEELPPALRDRFTLSINITEPSPEAIASLPADLQKIAGKLKNICDEDRKVSLRCLRAFAKLRGSIGRELAAQSVFGSRGNDLLNAIDLSNERKEV